MPELPDITVYCERLQAKVAGQPLQHVRLASSFVLRTAVPPIALAEGKTVQGVRRLGKRVVIELEGALFIVIHLMIAGRLLWLTTGAKPPGRITQASLEFAGGTLVLTEAGTQRRASIHLVRGEAALAAMDPGGLEVLQAGVEQFSERLKRERHTLKRSLTNPQLFSGIGNAYSDEILHRARLSPVSLSHTLPEPETLRLFEATQAVLREWTERLRAESPQWPSQGQVTAFRPDFAVLGRYGQPCPVCGTKVQRIVHASNETNYCARCQTGGRLLADRALSTLLKASWPRHVDDL